MRGDADDALERGSADHVTLAYLASVDCLARCLWGAVAHLDLVPSLLGVTWLLAEFHHVSAIPVG